MTNSTPGVFKLTAAAGIRKALSGVVEAKRNITISALFHGLISSNVSWATDMQRSDAADFDMVLRTLLPIKFNKDSGKDCADKLEDNIADSFKDQSHQQPLPSIRSLAKWLIFAIMTK